MTELGCRLTSCSAPVAQLLT